MSFANKFRSSIKARASGSTVSEDVMKPEKSTCKVYSNMMFIPDKNKIIDTVQPAKIPRLWRCQLDGAFGEQLFDHRPS